MGQAIVLFLILFSFQISSANMLMGSVKEGFKQVPYNGTPEGMYLHQEISPDGLFMGQEWRDLPATPEISYQNGNCVDGAACPGTPLPGDRPNQLVSCGENPNQDRCSEGEDSVEKDDDKRVADEEGEANGEENVASREPTGPSAICQASVSQMNQCAQVPQVNVSQARGNILGNYDAATDTMRRGSATLSQYSSQCQSLMSRCVSSCSSSNPFDQNLRGQCYRYQNQVNQASSEAKNLNAMSLQTEQAAASIRSGASDFKNNSNIGRGNGLQKEAEIQALGGELKQVSDKPLLDKVKLQSYSQMEEEEAAAEGAEVEKASVAQQKREPIFLASTVTPIQRDASGKKKLELGDPQPQKKSAFHKKTNEVDQGYFSLGKKRSRSRSRNYKSSSSSKRTSLAKKKVKKSHLLSPEEILKRRYEQAQRAVASEGGLFRQDMSIFYSICISYDAYERASGINEGQSKCPSAY